MMLLRYYGLSKEPFGPTPDPHCLYATSTHREALASLQYGFNSGRGFTALIAPPGMGKTTLLFRFLEDIQKSARTVFLFDIDNQCEPRELVGYILRDLGMIPAGSRAEMHAQLHGVLLAEARAGRKFVVVIDEAQNLSDAALETVRLLSNFETPRAKLIQIVLSGQPQLSDTLMRPSLLQLRQRISTLCRLEPLSAGEVHAYIDHRLKSAGYRGDPLFTQEAMDLIVEASHGVPRIVNNLCFNALSLCCALRRKQVDDRMVSEVIRDQQLTPDATQSPALALEVSGSEAYEPDQPRRAGDTVWLWAPAVAVLLIASVLAYSDLSKLRIFRSNKMPNALSSDATDVPAPGRALDAAGASTGRGIAATPFLTATLLGVMAAPNQTPRSSGTQNFAGMDFQSVQQGQALDTRLMETGSIDVCQSNWLPGSMAPSLARNGTCQANVRNIP